MVFLGIIAMMSITINGFVIFTERLRTNNNCISCVDEINEEEDNEKMEKIVDSILQPIEGYEQGIRL